MLVLFDIDDTLVDHAAAFRSASAKLYEQTDLCMPVEKFCSLWSTLHRQYFDRYLSGELTYEQQSRARIRETIDPMLTDDVADQLFKRYIVSYEAAWSLFPDVAACLDSLARHRLGVISNGQSHQQRRKLERTGIAGKFDLVLISEECGCSKPKADIFLHACSALHELPSRTIYVGDSYDVDVIGARGAGLVGVWLNRAGNASVEHAPPLIQSLGELSCLVDILERNLPSRLADKSERSAERRGRLAAGRGPARDCQYDVV